MPLAYASPPPSKLPGPTEDELKAFNALGDTRGRSYAFEFPNADTTRVVIFGASDRPLVVSLPTLLRGQLVVALRDFMRLESERPFSVAEIQE